MYSLYGSSEAVVDYLRGVSPAYGRKARRYYSKLSSFKDEAHEYGMAVAVGLVESQEAAVVQVLADLVRQSHAYLAQDGMVAGEELLQAKFNAMVRRRGRRGRNSEPAYQRTGEPANQRAARRRHLVSL